MYDFTGASYCPHIRDAVATPNHSSRASLVNALAIGPSHFLGRGVNPDPPSTDADTLCFEEGTCPPTCTHESPVQKYDLCQSQTDWQVGASVQGAVQGTAEVIVKVTAQVIAKPDDTVGFSDLAKCPLPDASAQHVALPYVAAFSTQFVPCASP